MTKQEEINQLIKIVCPHLECEDGEPSITLGGFEAIQDFYAARIKERDERIIEALNDRVLTAQSSIVPLALHKESEIKWVKGYTNAVRDLEQIMKGEEKDDV